MIPGGAELAVFMGNAVLGGVLKIVSQGMAMRADRHKRDMELLAAKSGIINQARDAGEKSPGFSYVRRLIAIIGIFFIVCWPKIVPVFWPDVPVSVSYSQFSPENFFRGEHEVVKWVVAEGVVVSPLDTMVIIAILVLFFGSEITKRR